MSEPWRVNPQTPTTILTPHGRISVGWSGNQLDELAEQTAAQIVRAINSHAELRDALADLLKALPLFNRDAAPELASAVDSARAALTKAGT